MALRTRSGSRADDEVVPLAAENASLTCRTQLPSGALCPTKLDQQCDEGRCVSENLFRYYE